MMLICDKKDNKQIVDLGKLDVSIAGKADYTKEYNENSKIICSIFIGQSTILLILVMALWSIISKFTKMAFQFLLCADF